MNRKILPLTVFLAACGGAVATTNTGMVPAVANAVWPEETGPMKWAPRATVTEITPNDLRTRLYQIADDSMNGRAIGSEGNFKTTSYIAREFERLGLKPGGDNGTYFQTLAYGVAMFDSARSSITIGSTPLTKKVEWVPLAPTNTNGLAAVANLQGVQTVFAGRWGDTTTVLDANAIRGKVAVFSAPIIPPAPPVPAGTRAPARPGANGNFSVIRDRRALAAGAAAVLVATLDSMPRTAGNNGFAANNAFNPRSIVFPAPVSALPGASISESAASKLFGRPISDLSIGQTGQPVTASWTYTMTPVRFPARNVIGILPGSDPARADEYTLVGAHNDHEPANRVGVDHDSLRAYNTVMRPQGANDCLTPAMPGCTPTAEQRARINALIAHARSIRAPRRDSIMNGADDDGSGTVVMLEVAERFAKERPARSVIFMSHQGEEAGLLGSAWFVAHPTVPLKQIVSVINMDMVGKGRVTDVRFGGPNSVQSLGSRRIAPQYGDIIDSVNAISKAPMAIDKSWDVPANPLNRFCRSDQVNYVNADIPTVYFSLGYARDYHQVTDEPQYIDYDHAARLGNFVFDIMMAVANRADRPLVVGQDTLYPSCK